MNEQIAALADYLDEAKTIYVLDSPRDPGSVVNEQGREWIVVGLRKLAAGDASTPRE